MEMEADEGTAVKPTTPPTPLPPGQSASNLASGSGTSASPTEEGDEGRQVKLPGQEEGEDCGVGADEGADPPSNEEDDEDDGWSTVSEDDSMEEGQAAHDDEEDDASLGSSENEDIEDGDATSDEGNAEDGDEDEGTDPSDKEGGVSTTLDSGGVEEEEEGLRLHPMKNPVILKNLFKLCPPRLLANFRLVCKDWMELSLEAWRSSITLQFDHNGRKVQLRVVDDDKEYGKIPLKDFLKYVDNPKNQCQLKPFRRYELSWSFKFPLEANKSLRTRKLWELVKRDATALALNDCSFPKLEVFREVIYKDLPNLQQLKLSCCRIGMEVPTALIFPMLDLEEFSKRHRKEPIPIGVYPEHPNLKSFSIELADNMGKLPLEWLELFSQFPSLTRLSLGIHMPDGEPEDQPLVITELLRALEAIRDVRKKDPRKLPLKEFDILPYFQTTHDHELLGQVFALLLELRLPLPSMRLL